MENPYKFNQAQQTQDRVYLRHQVYELASRQFLVESGLFAGAKVLEVACGPGYMTPILARLVGNNGSIHSFDISEDYVELARERLVGWNHVSIIHCGIDELHPANLYDIVYCRMILHRLQKPGQAVHKLLQHLKPKGVFICEEPARCEGAYCIPPSKAMSIINGLVTTLLRQDKLRYDIAYQLPQLLRAHGLELINQDIYQPILTRDKYNLITMSFEEMSEGLIEHQLINHEELLSLHKQLKKELSQAYMVAGLRMFQVAARKQ